MARDRGARDRWAILAILAVALPLGAVAFGPILAVRLAGGGFLSVVSESMAPALQEGDRILVPATDGAVPERGAVISFRDPRRGEVYLGRVIAFGGETAQLRGGVVHIDGVAAQMQRLPDRVLPLPAAGARRLCRNAPVPPGGDCVQEQWRETLPDGTTQVVLNTRGEIGVAARVAGSDDTPPFQVPEGHVFVLGDHRDNAIDSRFAERGTIPLEAVRGQVWLIQASFDRASGFPSPRFERFFRRVE